MNILPKEKQDNIIHLFSEGLSIAKVMSIEGVAKETARRYRTLLFNDSVILCPCGAKAGHRGWCSHRLASSPARQKFLSEHYAFGGRSPASKRKPIVIDRFLRWPYVVYGKNVPDIVIKVHEAVPLTIPEKIRPDVCQEVIVDLLSGVASIENITRNIKIYINRAYKAVSDYRVKSIYENHHGTDDLMIIDTLSDDNVLWRP